MPTQTSVQPRDTSAVNRLIGLSSLIESPRKADLWFTIWTQRTATEAQLSDELGLARSTTNTTLRELLQDGVVKRDTSTEPYTYTTAPIQLHISVPDAQEDASYTLSVELVGLRAHSRTDENIQTFIDRNGYTMAQECVTAMYEILFNDNYSSVSLEDRVDRIDGADGALIEQPLHEILRTVASNPTVDFTYEHGQLTQ